MQPYSSAKRVPLLDKHNCDTLEDKWFGSFSSSNLSHHVDGFSTCRSWRVMISWLLLLLGRWLIKIWKNKFSKQCRNTSWSNIKVQCHKFKDMGHLPTHTGPAWLDLCPSNGIILGWLCYVMDDKDMVCQPKTNCGMLGE